MLFFMFISLTQILYFFLISRIILRVIYNDITQTYVLETYITQGFLKIF